jgi:hypothetical protein
MIPSATSHPWSLRLIVSAWTIASGQLYIMRNAVCSERSVAQRVESMEAGVYILDCDRLFLSISLCVAELTGPCLAYDKTAELHSGPHLCKNAKTKSHLDLPLISNQEAQ